MYYRVYVDSPLKMKELVDSLGGADAVLDVTQLVSKPSFAGRPVGRPRGSKVKSKALGYLPENTTISLNA